MHVLEVGQLSTEGTVTVWVCLRLARMNHHRTIVEWVSCESLSEVRNAIGVPLAFFIV